MQPVSKIELGFPGLTTSLPNMLASKELHSHILCWSCVVFCNRLKQDVLPRCGMSEYPHIQTLEICRQENKSNVPRNFSQQKLNPSGCLLRISWTQSFCFMRNPMVLSTLSSKGSKPVRQTPNKDECPRRRKRKVRFVFPSEFNFQRFSFSTLYIRPV